MNVVVLSVSNNPFLLNVVIVRVVAPLIAVGRNELVQGGQLY